MYEANRTEIVEPRDWWDSLSAVVYFFAVMTVATRLVATGWVRDLDLVQTVAFLGIFTGLALGKSVFSKPVVFLFAFAYGLFIIPMQIGLTLGIGIEWQDRVAIMIERLQAILTAIILRADVKDNLFFLFVMATVFWIVSVYSGYQLVRHGDVWRAMVPSGVAIFIIHTYDPLIARKTWYLAFFIFLFLIILARNYYNRQNWRWKSLRTYVPPDAGFDFVRFTLLISVIIVLIAWNSPALAESITPISDIYHSIERPWQNAKERMGFMFASLRATVGLVIDDYAESQPLGQGSYNSDSPVMHVTAPRLDYPGLRFYWRARVYDHYEGAEWTTGELNIVDYIPDSGDLMINDGGQRTTAEFEITPRSALFTLYSPSQPLSFDRLSKVSFIPTENGAIDVVTVKASPLVRPGEPYTVRASLATVTELELREAGTDYPQWVLDRYLQVPDELSNRTKLLAERLAEGKDNPYDIASTITIWLRENIEYVEAIDSPPRGQEPLDWFLFDYRKGFCNYYSSAMVMMLRSLGIPARWAVGYAQGNPIGGQAPNIPDQLRDQVPELFFEDQVEFNVRQIDAHAWPEVFFPEIGWIEFEPTVSQSSLFRPSGVNLFDNNPRNLAGGNLDRSEDLPVIDDLLTPPEEETAPAQVADPTFFLLISIISITVGIALIAIVLVNRQRPGVFRDWWSQFTTNIKTPVPVQIELNLNRFGIHPPEFIKQLSYQVQLPPAARSFLEVNKANDRLSLLTHSSMTPYERVVVLCGRIPELSETAFKLLEEYQKELYGGTSPDEYTITTAAIKIRKVSSQIWFDNLVDRFRHPFRKSVVS